MTLETFRRQKNWRSVCLPIQDVFERFLNKLQEVNDFLAQLISVSPVVDGFRKKDIFCFDVF